MTMQLRHEGRIYNIEAVIIGFVNHVYAAPAESVVVDVTTKSVMQAMVDVGIRDPTVIAKTLQTHMRLQRYEPYAKGVFDIVSKLAHQL
jgi:hypothetical protein